MEAHQTPLERMRAIDERIDWVIAHPGMSAWLKQALKSAVSRNPVELLNDLEIMNALIRAKAEILIDVNWPQDDERRL